MFLDYNNVIPAKETFVVLGFYRFYTFYNTLLVLSSVDRDGCHGNGLHWPSIASTLSANGESFQACHDSSLRRSGCTYNNNN